MSKYIKLEDAIERLNQLYHSYEVEEWLKSLPTIEVCEDCISREYLKSFEYIHKGDYNSVETIREWIDNAPSVVPTTEQSSMVGEWLPIVEATEMGEPYIAGIYCSECGETLVHEANYCPNCGAKMKGAE